MKLTLLVMAAGMGSRYGGLKQLEPVGPNGETILDYAVFDAKQAGFERVVFVIRKVFAKAFDETVLSRFKDEIETELVYQEYDNLPDGAPHPDLGSRVKPWGTGHAVWTARNAIAGHFAIINADDYYGPGAFRTIASFLKLEQRGEVPAFCMAGYRLANTLSPSGPVSRGICKVSSDDLLEQIVEHKHIAVDPAREGKIFGVADPGSGNGQTNKPVALAPDTPVSMNLFGFTTALFPFLDAKLKQFFVDLASAPDSAASQPEFYLPSEATAMVRNKQATMTVLPVDDQWLGITHREDKPFFCKHIASMTAAGMYPAPLWKTPQEPG